MSLSVCIRCGAIKRRPMDRCPRCGFQPATDEEKAKSLLLSLDAEIDGEYVGRSKEELLALSQNFPPGGPEFDPALVARVIAAARQATSIPASRLAIDLVRWIALPLLVLAAVLLLLHFSK